MFSSYKEIDINWLKQNAEKIHFFGLGFIQIKINDIYRLHFYHSSLPPIVETPHTHRYNFTSTILKGNFTQDIYSITTDNIDTGEYWLTYESCGRGELPEYYANYKESVGCKLILSNKYMQGSNYTLDKTTFHTVSANDCITLLKRSEERDEFAKVLLEKKTTKICPFSVKYEEDILWKLVEEMLNNE